MNALFCWGFSIQRFHITIHYVLRYISQYHSFLDSNGGVSVFPLRPMQGLCWPYFLDISLLMQYIYSRQGWHCCLEDVWLENTIILPLVYDVLVEWWITSRVLISKQKRWGFDSLVMLTGWSLYYLPTLICDHSNLIWYASLEAGQRNRSCCMGE